MGETNYAKTFLSQLDNKKNKYDADYIFDPKTTPLRTPFTLPRLSNPPHPSPPKPASSASTSAPPGSEPSLAITLKSSKNPNLTLSLPSSSTSTTIQSLREAVQNELGGVAAVPIDKIKILYNKKPIPASKTSLADVLDGASPQPKGVELGVMVMGGAPDPVAKSKSTDISTSIGTTNADAMEGIETAEATDPTAGTAAATGTDPATPAQGPSGAEVLRTREFWTDLKGYLQQRLKDVDEAENVFGWFRDAWEAHSGV